jgi:hypothetical protein
LKKNFYLFFFFKMKMNSKDIKKEKFLKSILFI